MHSDQKVSPTEVLAAGLCGAALTAVVEGSRRSHQLPVSRWTGPASRDDQFLLERCRGGTIDLGCGPGRLAAELAARGHEVLGVDLSDEAVARTRRRGVRAGQQDVVKVLPREGRWDTALLADGNIGIAGDPVALLRRVRRLVRNGGRVVVDLAAPGTGLRVQRLHLRAGGLRSTAFAWAELGPDAMEHAAAHAGLIVTEVAQRGIRWLAVLVPEQVKP
jgi:SAM-dependent methyltransferase